MSAHEADSGTGRAGPRVTKVTVEAVPLRPSAALTVVKEDTTMTMTNEPVQIVTVTPSTADVRLRSAGKAVSIGRVQSSNGRWCWQHRDGEQSSAVAVSRSDAAEALASYHRAFKPQTRPGVPVRRLVFG